MIRPPDLLKSPAVCTALILGLALRVVLILLTPVGGASEAGRLSSYNDEIAHVHYVQHLLLTGRLPGRVESVEEEGALTRGEFENYQPPLYYVVVASLCTVFATHHVAGITFTGRFTALSCSLLMLWLLLRFAAVLSLSPAHRAAIVIFWALNGVMVRFASTAGNDPLFWLSAGSMILAALQIEKKSKADFRNALAFAVFAVLGLYTKLTILILLPLLPVAFAYRRPRAWVVKSVLVFLMVLAVSLPIGWRNLHSFGSFLPLSAGFGQPHWRLPHLLSVAYAIRSFFFPWSELWRGVLGLALMAPLILLSCAALISAQQLRLFLRSPALTWALMLTFIAYLGLNLRYDQAEARYLFAAWPTLAVLLTVPPRTELACWLLLPVSLLPYALMI
jgi:hypothetical protein